MAVFLLMNFVKIIYNSVRSFTEEYVDDICKVLLNHRDILSKNFAETKMDRVKMTKLQWRINISLSLKYVIMCVLIFDDIYT